MAKDLEDISSYFFLKKRITKTRLRMRNFEKKFNTSNFYTSIQERDDDITTVAFNIEREVVEYVSAVQRAEQHIQIMEYKQKHFKRFMQCLHSNERQYLVARYKHDEPVLNGRLDQLFLDEVLEIEEAVGYRFFNDKPAERIAFNPFEENGSFKDNFEEMLKRLEVKQ